MSILNLLIFGQASNTLIKKISFKLESLPKNISLMDFLQNNNIPIASSCRGEGVCSKCTVNDRLLSCQITLEQFISSEKELTVFIAYL